MQNSGCTLEVRNLTKRYNGIVAVDDISFTIRPGEVLGYLGPNGSGKSTTVKMLIGLIDPSQGTILLNGASVLDDVPEYQRRIGYVPEESNLYPYLSGREFLQLAGRLRGLPRKVLDERIEELLRLFSLWDDRDSAVSAYSKGMRQKVLLSAALIHNPDILILDEPLSGLDVNTMLVMRDLMRGLAARGRTIFYSSHVLDIVEKVCSRVLILRRGRVVADDSVGHLRETMQQPSLEGIFAELTEETNHDRVADGILAAIGAQ
jgi:ABC-2 type transport system ATP-binding protein